MNRRSLLTTLLGGTILTATAFGTELLAQDNTRRRRNPNSKMKKYPNSHFYNKDGSFNVKEAKDAYVELFRFHNYSLPDVVKDERFWAVDFGLGDFANVGMGGIFWLNDKEHGYFGHEIYLLPFQMIPEHAHVEAEGKPAKHEYWQVRHGSIFNFGKGGSKEDLKKLPFELPKSQLDANAITAFNCVELKAGAGTGKGKSEANLTGLGDFHFMIAGENGAIVTEYASFHSNEGLKFQNAKAKL
jgi:hypothetical protein